MSYQKDICCPPPRYCPDICPEPYVNAWNEPCVTSCGDSSAVVFAPPVVVRFPGPILATCPQDSFVGTSLPDVPYGYGGLYGSGSVGGSVGYGGGYGSGYGSGYGGGYGSGYGGGYGSGYGGGYSGSYGYGRRYRKCYSSRFGRCGPC